MLNGAVISGIFRSFCLEVNPESHGRSFGTAAETERLLRPYSKSWYETEPEQDSWSKEIKRSTNLNCLHIRIAPATLPKGFSVSKAVLE